MEMEKRLDGLLPGECGTVLSVDDSRGIKRRLMDIGLISGTSVVCIGQSPMGDPRAYLIRGKTVAIRKRDAHSVHLGERE